MQKNKKNKDNRGNNFDILASTRGISSVRTRRLKPAAGA